MTISQTLWTDLRDRAYFAAISLPLAAGLCVASRLVMPGIAGISVLVAWHTALATLTAWFLSGPLTSGPSRAVLVWRDRTAVLAAFVGFGITLWSAGQSGREAWVLAVWAAGVAFANPSSLLFMPIGVAFGHYLGRAPVEIMAATLIMAALCLASPPLRPRAGMAQSVQDKMISIYDFIEGECHDR